MEHFRGFSTDVGEHPDYLAVRHGKALVQISHGGAEFSVRTSERKEPIKAGTLKVICDLDEVIFGWRIPDEDDVTYCFAELSILFRRGSIFQY